MADDPLNPYAAPQDPDAFDASASPADRLSITKHYRPYQSARGKATLALWATVITVIMQVFLLASCYQQLALLEGGRNGFGIDQAAANANDSRQNAIIVAVGVSVVASLITFLVWVYAAHANLHALGCPDIKFTPGWAVGWFFVPLLNLFKPYQVVSEIWRGSDPASLLKNIPSSTALIGWWWGFRICTGILERVSRGIASRADTIDDLISVTWMAIALIIAIEVPMFALHALLIWKVQKFQDERYALIVAQPPPAAPSSDATDPFATFR